MFLRLFVLTVVIFSFSGCSESTYEDCLLSNLKNSNSDTAARMVSKVCRDKYPLPVKEASQDEPNTVGEAAAAAASTTEYEVIGYTYPDGKSIPIQKTPQANQTEKVIGLYSELYPTEDVAPASKDKSTHTADD